jgi:hypothetical protein
MKNKHVIKTITEEEFDNIRGEKEYWKDEAERRCSMCHYFRKGHCSCEDEMCASCIPTPIKSIVPEDKTETLVETDSYSVYRIFSSGDEYIEICNGDDHIRYYVNDKVIVIEHCEYWKDDENERVHH